MNFQSLRIYARSLEIEWLSHSPDQNPVEEHVKYMKSGSKNKKMECLKKFHLKRTELLKRMKMNIWKQAILGLNQNGMHFEQ